MFIVLFILGLCVIILGNWMECRKNFYVGVLVTVLGWVIYATSFFFLDGAVRQSDTPKYQTFEYPASKFDLKLKVTEYEGKRDTAYVFIFREGQRSFITEHLASKYELKLRITEYEGQRDTTYVLVKKPHSVSTNCK